MGTLIKVNGIELFPSWIILFTELVPVHYGIMFSFKELSQNKILTVWKRLCVESVPAMMPSR